MRSPREVPVSGAWPLRSKFRVGGRLIAVRETDRVVVRRAGAVAGEGRREALPAQEGAYAAPVRPGGVPRVGGGRVSPRVSDGGHAAGGGAVRGPGLRRAAVPAEFRLGGRLNPVRDAARITVQRVSAIAGEGRGEALPAREGAYAAPARVRESGSGVGGVGGVPRRVSDGGRAARGESVRGAGLRRAAVRADFRLGGRRITVRDAARGLVQRDSGIAEEGRRGALLAREGAYAAPVCVRKPSPGPGPGAEPGASPMAVVPPVGGP